jgi:hypothetical protein
LVARKVCSDLGLVTDAPIRWLEEALVTGVDAEAFELGKWWVAVDVVCPAMAA